MESDPSSSSSSAVQVGGLSVKQRTHVHTPHSKGEEGGRNIVQTSQSQRLQPVEFESISNNKNTVKMVNQNSESVDTKLPFGSTAAEKAKNIVRNIMVLVPHIHTPGLYPLGTHRLYGCISLRCRNRMCVLGIKRKMIEFYARPVLESERIANSAASRVPLQFIAISSYHLLFHFIPILFCI